VIDMAPAGWRGRHAAGGAEEDASHEPAWHRDGEGRPAEPMPAPGTW